MPDPSRALAWAAEVFRRNQVPFQVVGGLAARAYGATRPLVDLDFYVPLREFWPVLQPEVGRFVTWGPAHHRDAHWDISFVKLTYAGQPIELGDSTEAFFFDMSVEEWRRQVITYDRARWRKVLGVEVPIMPRAELVQYKQRLGRPVDVQDLQEMAGGGCGGT